MADLNFMDASFFGKFEWGRRLNILENLAAACCLRKGLCLSWVVLHMCAPNLNKSGQIESCSTGWRFEVQGFKNSQLDKSLKTIE